MQDLKIAARTLRKNPVFTIAAVVTIALGIGASTAIFSVTNAVLLRPLPYKNPGRLVIACMDLHARHVRDFPFSNEDFIDMRDQTKSSFQGFAGVFTGRAILPALDGTPEQVRIAVVTTNFFRLTGARIALGRDFTAQDGLPQPPPPPPGAQGPPAPRLPTMAILSYSYFERRFGGNPAILGHMMPTQGGLKPVILGVLAPHFRLYFPPEAQVLPDPEIWLANRLSYDNSNRDSVSIHAIGRLRDGVTFQQAQDAVDRVAAVTREHFLIERTAGYAIRLEPLLGYVVSQVRPAIVALMGAAIFLLLIACANVANLLLVRASLRERELAVRAVMGASRWRLIRQMLIEALLLAALGAAGGLLLAWAGMHELLAIAPATLPRLDTIRIDGPVLVFTAIAALAAAAIFGMLSAWRASRPETLGVLRSGGRTEGLTHAGMTRSVVAVIEVALAFVLLVGSGLMFRSFRDLERTNPGFDPQGLLTFQILGNLGLNPAARAAAVLQIRQGLQAIPGVQSVSAARPLPLAGGFSPIRWGNLDAGQNANLYRATDFQFVLPGYFETMRIPLLAGRSFTEADNQPGRNVVVVDQELARKAFPHGNAVGKQILVRVATPQPVPVEIIGVVAHTRDESLAVPGREQVYFTDGYVGSGVVNNWVIRGAGNMASYSNEVRATIKRLNPHLLVTGVQPVDALVLQGQAGTRFSLLLIGVFAVIALLLAAVGLYGVLATAVRQRTAEFGVRMALGSEPAGIFRLVVGQGLRLTVIGIIAGLAAAVALTRLIGSLLVGITPTDPATLAVMAVLFFVIATIASWLPAWRASRLDPNAALREQ
ncbi:MAG: ABC transporter permease [Terriglobales bacterium]